MTDHNSIIQEITGNLELSAVCDQLEAHTHNVYRQFNGSAGAYFVERLRQAGFKDYVPHSECKVAHRSWYLKKVFQDKRAYYVEIIETSLFGKYTEISGRAS